MPKLYLQFFIVNLSVNFFYLFNSIFVFRGRKITPQGRKDLDLIAGQVSTEFLVFSISKLGSKSVYLKYLNNKIPQKHWQASSGRSSNVGIDDSWTVLYSSSNVS